jgi:hypothetical protein
MEYCCPPRTALAVPGRTGAQVRTPALCRSVRRGLSAGSAAPGGGLPPPRSQPPDSSLLPARDVSKCRLAQHPPRPPNFLLRSERPNELDRLAEIPAGGKAAAGSDRFGVSTSARVGDGIVRADSQPPLHPHQRLPCASRRVAASDSDRVHRLLSLPHSRPFSVSPTRTRPYIKPGAGGAAKHPTKLNTSRTHNKENSTNQNPKKKGSS